MRAISALTDIYLCNNDLFKTFFFSRYACRTRPDRANILFIERLYFFQKRKPLRLPGPPPIPRLRGKGPILKESVGPPERGGTNILDFTLRGSDHLSSSWFFIRPSLQCVCARYTIEMIPSSMILQIVAKTGTRPN